MGSAIFTHLGLLWPLTGMVRLDFSTINFKMPIEISYLHRENAYVISDCQFLQNKTETWES